MVDFNSVVIVGRVVKTPVLFPGSLSSKTPPSCQFKVKSKEEIMRIVCYKRLAEICAQFLKKGREVLVMGTMRKGYVEARLVQFLGTTKGA